MIRTNFIVMKFGLCSRIVSAIRTPGQLSPKLLEGNK